MPLVTYETLFLLDPNKVAADAEAARQALHHIIERVGGQIEISRPWDYNHKLSYPIRKNKKGAYHIIYYTLESRKQADLEREFKLNPDLIHRHLTIHIDPKWLEIVMGVAREDPSSAFAVRGMRDDVGGAEGGSAGSGLGEGGEMEMAASAPAPRRGRRYEDDKPE